MCQKFLPYDADKLWGPRLEPAVAGRKAAGWKHPFYPEKTGLGEKANLSGDTKEQVYE
jgi:hypothetical protein